MSKRELLAPRPDGRIARLRVYDSFTPPLVVDTDRAYAAAPLLGSYNRGYLWSTRLFTGISSVLLFGGFISLLWWPWWTPIITSFLAMSFHRGVKQSCADFVHDIIRDNPDDIHQLVRLGIVWTGVPSNAMPG